MQPRAASRAPARRALTSAAAAGRAAALLALAGRRAEAGAVGRLQGQAVEVSLRYRVALRALCRVQAAVGAHRGVHPLRAGLFGHAGQRPRLGGGLGRLQGPGLGGAALLLARVYYRGGSGFAAHASCRCGGSRRLQLQTALLPAARGGRPRGATWRRTRKLNGQSALLNYTTLACMHNPSPLQHGGWLGSRRRAIHIPGAGAAPGARMRWPLRRTSLIQKALPDKPPSHCDTSQNSGTVAAALQARCPARLQRRPLFPRLQTFSWSHAW